MTYNVFGGTLNLSQLQLARTSVAQTEQASYRLEHLEQCLKIYNDIEQRVSYFENINTCENVFGAVFKYILKHICILYLTTLEVYFTQQCKV